MASSAERMAVMTLVALSVTGCVSTQQKAARIQLNDARVRAAERPTRVTRAGSAVTVLSAQLLRRGRRTAFVVRVHNDAPGTISDLPISVGARSGRRRLRFLNARSSPVSSDGYFASHLPPLAGRATIDWVYVTERPLPERARPLVVVGATPAVPGVPRGTRPPALGATLVGGRAGRATITLRNRSAIPQYQLPVYAISARGGRILAAGDAIVPELDAGASLHLSLTLVGRSGGAAVQIQAPATTFP